MIRLGGSTRSPAAARDGSSTMAPTSSLSSTPAATCCAAMCTAPALIEPLVRYDGSLVTSPKSHLYADERGSIIATEGTSTSINKYDEYGVPAASQSDLFQYTGQVWLADVGLDHYKARFYNAEIGRFMET